MADTGADGRKILTDTAWNYGAFALMAGTGVIINFFVAAVMGVEALGVFNQIYAVFVVAGQLAAMGIHDSAQKHAAEHADDPRNTAAVATASVYAAGMIGGLVAIGLYLASGVIGELADSEPVGLGIALVAPGIGLFALNKTLMGLLNGMRRMRAFAAVQSLRVLVILGVTLVIGLTGRPAYELALAFTIAEAVVAPSAWLIARPDWRRVDAEARRWFGRHLNFGVRALPNGFLAESFIRVDIIMLGLFMSDSAVGVYSFAAMFVEGLFQVPVVVRTIANPVLVRLIRGGDGRALASFARKAAAGGCAIFTAGAVGVFVVLPFLDPLFPAGLVSEAIGLLYVLLAGLFVYSVFIPLDHILLQAGKPGRQSMLMSANVAINVALNAALIPLFGLIGAAMATAASFIISAVLLNMAAARWMGLRRGVLLAPK
jgi:O-antigen/teichoic acid export membrane protein